MGILYYKYSGFLQFIHQRPVPHLSTAANFKLDKVSGCSGRRVFLCSSKHVHIKSRASVFRPQKLQVKRNRSKWLVWRGGPLQASSYECPLLAPYVVLVNRGRMYTAGVCNRQHIGYRHDIRQTRAGTSFTCDMNSPTFFNLGYQPWGNMGSLSVKYLGGRCDFTEEISSQMHVQCVGQTDVSTPSFIG